MCPVGGELPRAFPRSERGMGKSISSLKLGISSPHALVLRDRELGLPASALPSSLTPQACADALAAGLPRNTGSTVRLVGVRFHIAPFVRHDDEFRGGRAVLPTWCGHRYRPGKWHELICSRFRYFSGRLDRFSHPGRGLELPVRPTGSRRVWSHAVGILAVSLAQRLRRSAMPISANHLRARRARSGRAAGIVSVSRRQSWAYGWTAGSGCCEDRTIAMSAARHRRGLTSVSSVVTLGSLRADGWGTKRDRVHRYLCGAAAR